MKKKNFILMLLIAATLALFLGYRALDAIRTDTRAPEIRLDSVIPEISVEDPKSALLQGNTAVDSGDGDVTSSLVVERVELLEDAGRLLVHYAAFDSAGNVAKAQREAKYTDYHSPRFTLEEPLVYRQGAAFDVLSTYTNAHRSNKYYRCRRIETRHQNIVVSPNPDTSVKVMLRIYSALWNLCLQSLCYRKRRFRNKYYSCFHSAFITLIVLNESIVMQVH